jgi:nucleotide-binding universal stress UspA family protein
MIPQEPEHILVPTDFSETASHAMRYASDLALRMGSRLTVVHADLFVPPIDYTATIGGWDAYSFDHLQAAAKERLCADAKANIDPAVPYDLVIRVATPLDGIVAEARDTQAGLIVMGTHGRTGFRRIILGSVTEDVMRKAVVPVLAIPPGGEWNPAMKTIICPAAYNLQCRDALLLAAAIAPVDAKFIIIRSTPENDVTDTGDALIALRAWVPLELAGRCEFKIFGSGHLAGQVEGFAQKVEADLIVGAERNDRTAADVLYGTFAARLIQHSDCPVLSMNRVAAGQTAQARERELELASAHR